MSLDTVPLGNTGLRVSEIALGTWRFGGSRAEKPDIDERTAYELLDTYAERGGNFIDTADRYGGGRSEEWIGNWLADRERDEFVIASKVGRRTLDRTDLSRKYLRRQLEQSLDRLGTDYLDVFYAHRLDDDDTPVRQYMQTFNSFIEEGTVHYVAVSSGRPPDTWRIVKANEVAKRHGYEPFTVAQPRYNLVARAIEGDYLDVCEDYGMGVVPYNPLAEGFLTGKYARGEIPDGSRAENESTVVDRYFSDENFDVLDRVERIADEIDASPVQVSLAWLLHHPAITAPAIGARTPEQLEENLGAADVALSEEQFESLQRAE